VRLATIITPNGPRLHVKTDDGGYADIAAATGDERHTDATTFLQTGQAGMEAAAALRATTGRSDIEEKDFGPAVPRPGWVWCLGLNYSEHALEGGREVPTWPDTFTRSPDTVTGPYANLTKPALTSRFDYEGELGIVIGQGGRYIPASKAIDAIAGFTVLNDASARDWQRAGTQWTPGKNFDGTMPIGPEIVTPDELDVADLELTTTLNGQVMQHARTSQMLVDVPSTVEFFSSFATLRPGDVIATGTPGGVGFARTPPVWLNPGDVIEISIEGIGAIRNHVVAENADLTQWRWRPGATNAGL
jgi:acylpyruvate hydrolase